MKLPYFSITILAKMWSLGQKL